MSQRKPWLLIGRAQPLYGLLDGATLKLRCFLFNQPLTNLQARNPFMLRRNILLLSGIAATTSVSTLIAGCGSGSSSVTTKDIFELVRSNADLSVLGDAIIKADLVQTFQSNTSYTLFAPNNAAFVAALAELGFTKDQLFANKSLLTTILTLHLLPGKIKSVDILLNTPLKTVGGPTLKVDNVGGSLTITDDLNRASRIIQIDLEARNGVVHVIDKVLLPNIVIN
jgi:uncharacterized surface protein with fasciclin (FAS1) repeats